MFSGKKDYTNCKYIILIIEMAGTKQISGQEGSKRAPNARAHSRDISKCSQFLSSRQARDFMKCKEIVNKMSLKDLDETLLEVATFRESLFQVATFKEDTTYARLLIEAGANVNASACGFSILMSAVFCQNHELLELLLDQGADVDKDEGGVPIIEAARLGDREAVRILSKHRANVNAKSKEDGNTALHCATDSAIVDLLIDAGADVDIHNDEGVSAAMSCLRNKTAMVQKELDVLEKAERDKWSKYKKENEDRELAVQKMIECKEKKNKTLKKSNELDESSAAFLGVEMEKSVAAKNEEIKELKSQLEKKNEEIAKLKSQLETVNKQVKNVSNEMNIWYNETMDMLKVHDHEEIREDSNPDAKKMKLM